MTHIRTAAIAPVLFCSVSAAVHAQTYERIDLSTSGEPGNTRPLRAVLSENGRIAAFQSDATNLVQPDQPFTTDLYVRDRATSTTVRIASDVGSPTVFMGLEITGDGRWIAYDALQDGHFKTFVHDQQLGTTTQVATTLADARLAGITPDGRYLAIAGRTTAGYDVWRLDRQTGALLLASRDPAGMPVGAVVSSWVSAISADGDALVFASEASTIVPGDTNASADIFLFRASTSTVERISVDDAGGEANRQSMDASISADGSKVVFSSLAFDLDPAQDQPGSFVYLRDRSAGTTRLVSATSEGSPMHGVLPRIASDGQEVTFTSTTQNQIPGDVGLSYDVFVRDVVAATTHAASVGGHWGGDMPGSIGGGGRWATFTSQAPSLPDQTANGGAFAVDMGPACSVESYCTALPNSSGLAGEIGYEGEPSLHFGSFVLSADHLPPNAIAILAAGTVANDPGVPFGNGLRCIGGALVRHATVHAVNGLIEVPLDFALPAYGGLRPGDELRFQWVYRDFAAGGAAFNTTDALKVTFCW
jgi:hypothetical protein